MHAPPEPSMGADGYESMKRALDVLGALVLGALTLPVIVAAALAVRLTMGAPVLYRQRRAGRHGLSFTLWKLRTMDAAPGPDAARLTYLGRVLRALSIDEDHGNRISLLLGAQAKAGDAPVVISIDTKLKPELVEQIRAKQLTHNGEMQLTPGKYDVRVVVRDNLNGRIGSIVAPIEVR